MEALFRDTRKTLQFVSLRADLHAPRHVGLSTDFMNKALDLNAIQCRGRWLCLESVRRYSKPASLLRSIHKATDAQVFETTRIEKALPTLLVKTVPVWLLFGRQPPP